MKHPAIILPSKRQRRIAPALFILAVILNIYVFYGQEEMVDNSARQFSKRAVGSNGVVASENKICSDIGVDILKLGGSAVDSVIATGLCIGTTNMYSSGIGGGGFLVTYDTEKSIHFDFREMAPAGSHPDMYVKNPLKAQVGGLAVGVPGELKGYYEAWKLLGKLKWKTLVEPSIRLAQNGWIVNTWLAKRIESGKAYILNDPLFSRTYAPNGTLLVKGDLISRPIYANTLREIAKHGPDILYKGWMAKEIIETVQKTGGIMTMEDITNYHVDIGFPLTCNYRDYNVISSPAPASGAVLISALNILENYKDFKALNEINIHRIIEAFKFAYAKRGYMGDPYDPVYKNITEIVEQIISKEIAQNDQRRIDDSKTFEPGYYKPQFRSVDNHGTMHVSVLTADGQAAALTSVG